jgi:hypothetical protein
MTDSSAEKPIVFLSHSSLDKEPLAALKKILDDRAAGSLNFFLSSDGESIRLGRNWVVSVSDALKKAKLMFVFLSSQSAESKWIHFEAGCAYSIGIQVVPVCLPGIDLNRITPPLSLLQGFNLHSHETMGNLARICNETFKMKINEEFNEMDFNDIVGSIVGQGVGFFGDQTWAVDSIKFSLGADILTRDFNPFSTLDEVCKKASMNCHTSAEERIPNQYNKTVFIAQLELPGCIGQFWISEKPRPSVNTAAIQGATAQSETNPWQYKIEFTLSPELFHINAPLLDQWLAQMRFACSSLVNIIFQRQIHGEMERHRLTTKLYQCGIGVVGLKESQGFVFDGLTFHMRPHSNPKTISFTVADKLEDKRIPLIIERLFRSRVLWEHQPDLSEMLQAS